MLQFVVPKQNRLVFAVETHCVFCHVGNEPLNVIYMNFLLQKISSI